ncbi:MAG: hypothetical protein JJT96_10875 [Opitutales bacterium]|nr:hypothetical protein [Opitutales bacterium]
MSREARVDGDASADLPALCALAANPETPPTDLEELAGRHDPSIDACLAANPATPRECLRALAEDFPDAFLGNPILNLWALAGAGVRINFAWIEQLAAYGRAIREGDARAVEKVFNVSERKRLAEKPGSVGLWRWLLEDPEWSVRAAALRAYPGMARRLPTRYLDWAHPLLCACARDPHPTVRSAAAAYPNLPLKDTLALADDIDVTVRAALAETDLGLSREAAHLRLIEHGQEYLLCALARNPKITHAVGTRLANGPEWVRDLLSRCEGMPASVILLLAETGDTRLLLNLARQNTPLAHAIYKRLAEANQPLVDECLLQKDWLPRGLRYSIVGRLSDDQQEELAGTPSVPAAFLADLCRSPQVRVRRALARRVTAPNQHRDTADHRRICTSLAMDEDDRVRAAILGDRRVDPLVLRHWALSPPHLLTAPETRMLAGNASLATPLRVRFLLHPDGGVFEAALAALDQTCADALLELLKVARSADHFETAALAYRLSAAVILERLRCLQGPRLFAVARTRGIPESVLGWLADEEDPALLRALAARPFRFSLRLFEPAGELPRIVRWKFLVGQRYADLQMAIPNTFQRAWFARFGKLTDEQTTHLAADPRTLVRYRLCDNVHARFRDEDLAALCDDPVPLVKGAAGLRAGYSGPDPEPGQKNAATRRCPSCVPLFRLRNLTSAPPDPAA